MRNLLVAQSGGPTSAINATIAGVIMEAPASDQVDTIYGAVNGIKGVLEERFVNLSEKVPGEDELEILCQTPAAALGSCRVKLKNPEEDDSQFQEIIRIFRKHGIAYFIYAGGNDSMDTVDKLAAYCKEHEIEDIHVMGAPKTIDNDLVGTDHCPGFGSAAKYIATTFSELERDCHVYDTKAVTIVEVMGRNAGWLTAASALARNNGAEGPSLIYLCEPAFSVESFLADVKGKLEKQDSVLVAISEGIKDKEFRIDSWESDLLEIIIVRLGGEGQEEMGLLDLLYGLFSGNQKKVLSYIPDSDNQVRQKEVSDMLSMISYAEENGEKKGENRLGTLMNILLKNKRYSDAEKASEDEEYREELYKEYKL